MITFRDDSPVFDPNTKRVEACECGAPLKWRDEQKVCPYGCISIDPAEQTDEQLQEVA